MAKESWLDQGPIGDWQKPVDHARSSAEPAGTLTHQSTSDEVVSFVNDLGQAERERYHELQPGMCPPGYRWSTRHRLVREDQR